MLLAALTLAQAATPTSTSRYLALDAGGEHQCTLRADGLIRCWGGNSAELRDIPEGRYTAVSAGAWHNCAIRQENGEIACWGSDSNAPDGAFVDVAVGWQFACGVRETSQLECWGTNSYGRSVLDYGQADPPDGEFASVSAGYLQACGLRTTGEVTCWGRANLGRTNAPEGIFTQVSAGTTHSCAVRESGAVECWGLNNFGQLNAPSGVFTQISAGAWHSCGFARVRRNRMLGRRSLRPVQRPVGALPRRERRNAAFVRAKLRERTLLGRAGRSPA